MSQCGCPGSQTIDFGKKKESSIQVGSVPSHLEQWPIQLHLVSPVAPYFQKADVVIAADCVAFSYGNFHEDFLKGKALGIGCPKLDSNQEVYKDKIKSLIDDADVNSITSVVMQVPCCTGLTHLIKSAAEGANRKVPVKNVVISLQGEILSEEWI